jgi:hypothetical protein
MRVIMVSGVGADNGTDSHFQSHFSQADVSTKIRGDDVEKPPPAPT